MKRSKNAGLPTLLITLILTLFVGVLTGLPLAADPLTDAERQRLLDHLDHTHKLFLDSVEGLTAEQWNYKAGDDRWSIAQCAEHIAAAESMFRGTIEGLLAGQEASGQEASGVEPMEEKVLVMMADRSDKGNAPEPLVPTGRFESPEESLKAFVAERAKTRKLAREGGDLRAVAKKNPLGFNLDAYGWFFFISSHTERHTSQIEEVKASPEYPSS